MSRWSGALALAMLMALAGPALAGALPEDDDGAVPPPPAPPAPRPDPAPYIAPPGLYYVTETYRADVVTTSGPLTTYGTSTVHESTGSYARVLETVGTGVASAFDGAAFNGRRKLSDGRSVAGTYYENYVLTAGGFVPVSVVFFQDDAELAWLVSSPPARTQTTCCGVGTPLSPGAPIRSGASVFRASGPVGGIEILRGRPLTLWLRAFLEEREIPVRSWTLASGEAGDAEARSGTGAVPFRSAWLRLPPPGDVYELRFRLDLDTPETGPRAVDATIAVTVRSPALQE